MKNKIKRERVITEIDGIKIGDEVPSLDYGRVESFFEEAGVLKASVRDYRGTYVVSIEELKEMLA
jgi:hypothetical protein